MIELELYAAGIRNMDKIIELDHQLEEVPGMRYKVDSNHDIVYLEFDEPTLTLAQIQAMFSRMGLSAKIVGSVPPELSPKSKTQPLHVG